MNSVWVVVIRSVLHILAVAVWTVSLPLLSLGSDYNAISNSFVTRSLYLPVFAGAVIRAEKFLKSKDITSVRTQKEGHKLFV